MAFSVYPVLRISLRNRKHSYSISRLQANGSSFSILFHFEIQPAVILSAKNCCSGFPRGSSFYPFLLCVRNEGAIIAPGRYFRNQSYKPALSLMVSIRIRSYVSLRSSGPTPFSSPPPPAFRWRHGYCNPPGSADAPGSPESPAAAGNMPSGSLPPNATDTGCFLPCFVPPSEMPLPPWRRGFVPSLCPPVSRCVKGTYTAAYTESRRGYDEQIQLLPEQCGGPAV